MDMMYPANGYVHRRLVPFMVALSEADWIIKVLISTMTEWTIKGYGLEGGPLGGCF